jgi:excisionase family DNA binding protein
MEAFPVDAERKTLSITEAAKALGISRSFAYEAAREGKIPVIRLGTRMLVPVAALDRMLADAGKTDQPAAAA